MHGSSCSLLEHGAALLHCAGTPCVDYSLMGRGDGVFGPTVAFFLSWIGLRRKISEPLIVQECVQEFEEWLFLDLLPMYFVDYIVLSPSDLGWPIARRRKWCVLLALA